MTNVTLPNWTVVSDVPDGITQTQLKAMAIKNGLATEADFGTPIAPIPDIRKPKLAPEAPWHEDYLSKNAEAPGSVGGALTGAGIGGVIAGPPGAVVGGVVGGAVGSFGGSLYSDNFEGEDLDYVTAMEEAAISAGLDLATLGAGKILKAGWLASKKFRKSPAEAVMELAQEAGDSGSALAIAQSQKILNEKGLSLTPFQAKVGTAWDITKENLGRTGLISKNVFKDNLDKIQDVVRERMRSVMHLSQQGAEIPSHGELGSALYDAFDQGRKALTETYGRSLDDIGTRLGSKGKEALDLTPLKKGLTRFSKNNQDSLGNSTLNKKTLDVIDELNDKMKDVTSSSGKYLLDFERALNKKINEVGNFGSPSFDPNTARELTSLAKRMKVISRVQMGKLDPVLGKEFRQLQKSYGQKMNTMFPDINTRFMTQAGKGGFSSLGRMFSLHGASDNISATMKSIDKAYKQMSPKDLAKLPYKSALNAKKAVRRSYIESVLPDASKAEFSLKNFKSVAKELNTPSESARVRSIMGGDFESYRKTVNLMASASSNPESGLATLFMRSKEFTALGGLAAGMATGVVKGAGAIFSVATFLGGPYVLAKIATSPKHVNKLIALDKMGAQGKSYADIAAFAAVIANDYVRSNWEREQLEDTINSLFLSESTP